MLNVEITPENENVTSVTCKPGDNTSIKFVIANKDTNKVYVGLRLYFANSEDNISEWITIKIEPNEKTNLERTLYPAEDPRDNKTITVEISPPDALFGEDANSKEYQFRLRVYNRDNTDFEVQSENIAVTVKVPKVKRGFFQKVKRAISRKKATRDADAD